MEPNVEVLPFCQNNKVGLQLMNEKNSCLMTIYRLKYMWFHVCVVYLNFDVTMQSQIIVSICSTMKRHIIRSDGV